MRTALSLALLVIANISFAQPAPTGYSGTMSTGSSFTVTGTGFGTKPSAAPQFYDDFEAGTPGQSVFASGMYSNWITYPSPVPANVQPARFSSADALGGSGSMMIPYFSPGKQTDRTVPIMNRVDNKNFYADYWMRWSPPSDWWKSPNWKVHRVIRASESLWDGSNTTYLNFYCRDPVMGRWGYDVVPNSDQSDIGSRAPGLTANDFGGSMPGFGMADLDTVQWFHVQFYYESSTIDTKDGHLWAAVSQGSQTSILDVDVVTRTPNCPVGFATIALGQYVEAATWADGICIGTPMADTTRIFLDYAYVDTVANRVEIGDAPTYTGCINRVVQVATSWSATSVTFDVDLGPMESDGFCYVYIVDGDNVWNPAGMQVQIDTEYNPPPGPPGQPQNLTATKH